jgi:hypothetical protein
LNTTSQLKRVTLSFDESKDLLPAIKAFGDVRVNKVTDHTITYKTLKDQEAQFVPEDIYLFFGIEGRLVYLIHVQR